MAVRGNVAARLNGIEHSVQRRRFVAMKRLDHATPRAAARDLERCRTIATGFGVTAPAWATGSPGSVTNAGTLASRDTSSPSAPSLLDIASARSATASDPVPRRSHNDADGSGSCVT